jgi:hypothetical protein
MRTRLLVVAAAGLSCGFTATLGYERQSRENVGGPIALATQECWGRLKGKAQVEWYEHLRKIDETARAAAVMTSTARRSYCVSPTPPTPRSPTRASGRLSTHS